MNIFGLKYKIRTWYDEVLSGYFIGIGFLYLIIMTIFIINGSSIIKDRSCSWDKL